jgi:hypothetical protein
MMMITPSSDPSDPSEQNTNVEIDINNSVSSYDGESNNNAYSSSISSSPTTPLLTKDKIDKMNNINLHESAKTLQTALLFLSASASASASSAPASTLSSSSMKKKKKSSNSQQSKQLENVSFSEIVNVRNYVHVTEFTPDEILAAWFRGKEYKTIHKNNVKIIRNIDKMDNLVLKNKNSIKKSKKQKQKQSKRHSFSMNKNKNKRNNHLLHDHHHRDQQQPCVDHNNDHNNDHIDHDDEEEERGYSIRGLENETSSARKLRDDIYYRARYTVLSIQEDISAQIESMHDEFNKINKKKNKASNKQASNNENKNNNNTEVVTTDRDTNITTKFTFAAQYNEMSSILAEKYCEICDIHAKDARERGLYDELTARKINSVPSEQQQNGAASRMLNNNEGGGYSSNNSLSSGSVDQRRPSTTSTEATEGLECDDEDNDNDNDDNDGKTTTTSSIATTTNRIRLAKKFLRKFKSIRNKDKSSKTTKSKVVEVEIELKEDEQDAKKEEEEVVVVGPVIPTVAVATTVAAGTAAR